MRAIPNTVMAALVVLALFWGNCFSCPLALQAEKAAHGCCHHRKPTTPSSDNCQTQVLKNFVKADPAAAPAPAPAVLAIIEPVPVDLLVSLDPAVDLSPDRLSLLASFRV
jgi:hypothetical protein